MAENILDYKDSKPRPNKLLSLVFILSLTLFLYWFLSGYLGWPYGGMALLIGLSLLLVLTVVRFFVKSSRRIFEYFYFFGKLALFGAIFLVLTHLPGGFILTWTAFLLFVMGLAALYLIKK